MMWDWNEKIFIVFHTTINKMCDCTAALRHWCCWVEWKIQVERQGSNITHTHTRIKSSSAIVSWDLQDETSQALQQASGCHRRVGEFLFQLFWCSSHFIYITHTPSCHTAFPACVSACEGLPRLSLHLKTAPPRFPGSGPDPQLLPLWSNTPLGTERHAASSGGRVNNTSAFKWSPRHSSIRVTQPLSMPLLI